MNLEKKIEAAIRETLVVGNPVSIGRCVNKLKLIFEQEKQNKEPHEVSTVKCDLCGHSWVAVRPLGLHKLECPNCLGMVYFENIDGVE